MRWLANLFIKRTGIAARAMLPSSASSYLARIALTMTSATTDYTGVLIEQHCLCAGGHFQFPTDLGEVIADGLSLQPEGLGWP